jgi:MFS family permease
MLRERYFRRYWAGQSISMFGDQISGIVLPLVGVLTLHTSPAQMGILTGLEWLPSLVFGVHAGVWADRIGHRRQLMIAADLGRAALLATVPVCFAAGVLTLTQLYAVAFAAGTLSILFVVSDPALFVGLVPADRYVDGTSLVYGSRALSFVAGPSVGGLLVQWLTAPFAVVADALSFLGSAFFLSRIRVTEALPAGKEHGGLLAGARFIRGSAIIRASLVSASTINFFNFVFFTLSVLYAVRYLHIRPGELGLLLGAGALGGVLGAAVTRRLCDRIGAGWSYTAGCLFFTAPMVLFPLATGPRPVILAMVFGTEFLCGFGVMVLDISIGAIFAAVIPDPIRSRVSGAFQAVNYGVRPLGALAAGALGTAIGVRTTLWIAAIGGITGVLWLLPSRLARFRLPAGGASAADPAIAPGPAAPGDPAGAGQDGTGSPRYVPNDQRLPSGSSTVKSREP